MFGHFGRCIIRTPLSSCRILNTDEPADIDTLLDQKLTDKVFLESIYWASPALYRNVVQAGANLVSNREKHKKLRNTLIKYLIRSSTRCTPFGIFAGCGLLQLSGPGNTRHKTPSVTHPRRAVRLDMGFLQQLIRHIGMDPGVYPYLRYFPNTSIYRIDQNYRYIEYLDNHKERNYQLAEIERDNFIDQIIGCARNGATVEQLSEALGEGFTPAQKAAYVDELINTRLLISEMEPAVTENDHLSKLKQILINAGTSQAAVQPYLQLLDLLENALMLLDKGVPGDFPYEAIRNIQTCLENEGIACSTELFFQSDLLQVVQYDLPDDKTVKQVIEAVGVLSRLSVSEDIDSLRLKQFKKLFSERYHTAEIPLSEVLDAESGIGFPAMDSIGNLADRHFNMNLDSVTDLNDEAPAVLPRASSLRTRYETTAIKGAPELEITVEDLIGLENNVQKLSITTAALFSILPDGKLFLHAVGRAGAAVLTARFAYMDPAITRLNEEISCKEKFCRGAAVIAEIVHTPEDRAGNVVRRPVSTDFEIPYLGASVLDADHQLPIADLLVSVRGEEIILTSEKLKKQIIPRLSSAHNYHLSKLGTYKFLCALQQQGVAGCRPDWNSWAAGKKYRPRIIYKQIVLQAASWNFDHADYQHIWASADPITAAAGFLDSWKMPDYIAIVSGDHELFIDRRSDRYLEVLVEEIRKLPKLKIIEWLHFKPGSDTAFVNQIVLPLYNKTKIPQPHSIQPVGEIDIKRTFSPLSEWRYYKLFCGAHVSDKLLIELADMMERWLAEQLIDTFFFVRYTDPHYQLRVRIHFTSLGLSRQEIIAEALETFFNHYLENRQCWKVQADTYVREIERYGVTLICLAERIFFYDTQCCLKIMRDEIFYMSGYREVIALYNTDNWLNVFFTGIEDKLVFCTKMVNAFSEEFGLPVKREIEKNMRNAPLKLSFNDLPVDYSTFFEERNHLLHNDMLSCGKNILDLQPNLQNFIHMSLNRLFRTEQRINEFITYIYLKKKYLKELNSR